MVEIKSLRILLVSAKPHVAQVLRQVLTISGAVDITLAADGFAALECLRMQVYDAVFCDDASSRDTGADFAHDARKAEGMRDSMLPVFLVCSSPRRRDVERARDRGYTDVLTRPVSGATILRKLRQAVERPRPFIVAPEFYGPDRRSVSRSAFRGSDRRKRQPRKVKVAAPMDDPVAG